MNTPNTKKQLLWAITSYFNPCAYQRRLANYKIFRQGLNVPLITVELSYNDIFELSQQDAEILIQIKGNENNIMWQKERLLNIALQALPEECKFFAWLDCDIVFADKNWISKTIQELDNFKLVQPFKKACHLPKEITSEVFTLEKLEKMDSINYILVENSGGFHWRNSQSANLAPGRGYKDSFAVGMAWASHKEIFANYGFYDASIMGSGDALLWCAAYGNFVEAKKRYTEKFSINYSRSHHFLEWAQPFFGNINSSISFADCDLYHLWHGNMSDRKYHHRGQKLAEFDFNPYTDISLDDNGCWRWNSNKTELHQYVRDYFYSRKEDG